MSCDFCGSDGGKLIDRFAGHALQGLLSFSTPADWEGCIDDKPDDKAIVEQTAQLAWDFAEEMMKERERRVEAAQREVVDGL